MRNILAILPTIGKEFEISFDIKRAGFPTDWTSVLHFTQGGDNDSYGDRVPGVWVLRKNVTIAFAVDGEKNHQYSTEISNVWTQLRITQLRQNDSSYLYQISKEGSPVYSKTNGDPQEFVNVTLYSSDPWHQQFYGQIRNLEVCPNGKLFIEKNGFI